MMEFWLDIIQIFLLKKIQRCNTRTKKEECRLTRSFTCSEKKYSIAGVNQIFIRKGLLLV